MVRMIGIPGQATNSPFRGGVEQIMLKFVAEQIRFRVVFRFGNTVLADGVHTVFTFANWPLCSGCQ